MEFLLVSEDRIEINAGVMLGKPVIRGTRVTVELLLRATYECAAAITAICSPVPRRTTGRSNGRTPPKTSSRGARDCVSNTP